MEREVPCTFAPSVAGLLQPTAQLAKCKHVQGTEAATLLAYLNLRCLT